MNVDEPDFSKLNNEVIEEINRHKWIESEKAGYDIGFARAAMEWVELYYNDWLAEKMHQGFKKAC
jgi:hypothetical protein